MISCPKCGASNRTGAAVCRMCAIPLSGVDDTAGSRAEGNGPVFEASISESKQEATNSVDQEGITCPECKTHNEAGWSFCQQCGKRLPLETQTPPPNDWKPADGFRTVASDQLSKAGSVSSEMKTAEEEIPAGAIVSPPPPTTPPPVASEGKSPIARPPKPAAPDIPPPPRVEPPPVSPQIGRAHV